MLTDLYEFLLGGPTPPIDGDEEQPSTAEEGHGAVPAVPNATPDDLRDAIAKLRPASLRVRTPASHPSLEAQLREEIARRRGRQQSGHRGHIE